MPRKAKPRMTQHTVPAESLKEGSLIFVTGKLAFSRLAKPIDGQELAERVARQRAAGRTYPTTVPHTTVTLTDAKVLTADPTRATPEETFVHETLYVSKSGEHTGKTGYSIDNSGAGLPVVLAKDEQSGEYSQVVLEKDLAAGLDVTLVLNVFKSPKYAKRGVGLSQVLVNEPVRYYSSGVDTDALAARGIVVRGPVQTVTAPAAEAAPAQAAPALAGPALVGTVIAEDGLPMPGAFAPAQDAVPPAAETPAQRLARLQQEAQELQTSIQASGGGSPFDAVPAAAANPADPWGGDNQGGIRY